MLSIVHWINPNGGDWDTASNWDSGSVPGPNDDVVVSVAGGPTITHANSTADSVHSITATDPITLTGGTLTVVGQVSDTANVAIAGATLAGATIASGTTLLTDTTPPVSIFGATSTLRDVTIAGTLQYVNTDTINVAGAGLTLAGGTVHMTGIGNGLEATLNFAGTQALAGTGTVQVDEGTINLTGIGGTLTIAPGITIQGVNGYWSYLNAGSGTIDNQGTIDANHNDTPDPHTLSVTSGAGGSFTNDGTMEATNGGELDLTGTWTNNAGGQLVANAGTLSLQGTWSNQGQLTSTGAALVELGEQGSPLTLASLGHYTRDANGHDTFALTGTLNLAGQTLDTSAGPGPWAMAGATIIGGTVATTLDTNTSTTGLGTFTDMLEDVTLAGTLNYSKSDAVNITGSGLTLAGGTITMSAGSLNFSGTQALAGTGTITIGGALLDLTGSGWRLTIAPGIAINEDGSGGIGSIDAGSGQIVDQGSVADTGTTLVVQNETGGSWSIGGSVEATGSSTLALTGNWSITGTSPIQVDHTQLLLTGTWTNSEPIDLTNGATLKINQGTWSNTVPVTANNSSIDWEGTWTNSGAVTATGSSNLYFAGSWTNSGTVTTTGTVSSSSLTFAGNWTNSAPLALEGFATLEGTWTDTGTVSADNQGVLNVSDTAPASGSFDLTAGATLNSSSTTWSSAAEIRADASSVNFGGTWSNAGTITGENRSTIDLEGTWSNTGTLSQLGSTLILGGSIKTSGLGTLLGQGGTTEIKGTLTNDGTLAIDAATGSIALLGAIVGGTVTTAGGAALLGSSAGNGTLDGVTLAGTFDLTPASINRNSATIIDGLTLDDARILMSYSYLFFNGVQTLGGTGEIELQSTGATNLVPEIDVGGGGQLTIGPGVTIHGFAGVVGAGSGQLTNQGTISADAGGAIQVYSLTNYASGTLTGGTWSASNGGQLELPGDNLTTNAANLTIAGSGSQLYQDLGVTPLLSSLTTNAAAGSIALSGGAAQTLAAALTNAGSITLDATSKLTVPGYTQTAGTTTLAGGTLAAAGGASLQGGTLSGPGTIQGNLTNAAQVGLNGVPGVLAVTGSFAQTAAGALAIRIGGITPGTQFDQIQVGGVATLGGTLNVTLIGGFGPSALQVFPILTYAGSSGGFATVNLPLVGGIPAFVLQTTATSYNLVGVTTAADLAVDPASITVTPAPAIVGQNVTVHFIVDNLGTPAASGSWVDSVYLSAGTTLSADDPLIGRVTHTGDVAGLTGYSESLTATLPGVTDGSYHVIVVTDSQMQVPDVNRANNVAAGATPLTVTTPVLTLGTPVTGEIASGQDQFFRLVVPPGSRVELDASFAVALESELLVKFGAVAEEDNYDLSAPDPTSLAPQLVLPSGQGGPYYIRLHGGAGAGAGQPFTLQAHLAALVLQSFTPPSAGNQGPAVLNLTGIGFTAQTVVSLNDGAGHVIPAQAVTFVDSSHLTAAFDLTGRTAGNYMVQVADGSQSAQSAASFQVVNQVPNPTQTPQSSIQSIIIAPGEVEVGQPIAVQEALINTGHTPVLVPLAETSYGNAVLESPSSTLFGGIILAPGAKTSFGLLFDPKPHAAHTTSSFTLGSSGSTTPIDWSNAQRDAQKPDGVPADAWDAIWTNYTAALGPDAGSLEAALQADATYFAQLGETPTQSQLIDFEEEKANDSAPGPLLTSSVDSASAEPGLALTVTRSFVQSITGRYQTGLFGRGWSSNWDITLTTATDTGIVSIQQGPITREFAPQPDGTYLEVGDGQDVLTQTNGAFTLRETDGTILSFLPGGQFNFIADKDGNRITAGYTDNLLTSLTHSDGDQLLLSYNASGLVSQITQPDGQTVTYTYSSFAATKGSSITALSVRRSPGIESGMRKEQRRERIYRQTRGEDPRGALVLRPSDPARLPADGRDGVLLDLAVLPADFPQSAAA